MSAAWPSEDARERAIQTNELWELHWYPRTPVSFCYVCAPTLDDFELVRRIGMGGMGFDLSPIIVFFGITILQGAIC